MSDEKDLQPNEQEQTGTAGGYQTVAGTIRQTIFKRPGSREQVPATEATDANLKDVNATTVLMKTSGSEGVTAERVTMDHSGARSIDAKSVQMDGSGVVALSSESAVLLKSSAVQVVAEKARLSHSSAVFVSSGEAEIDQSKIVIFAGKATGDVDAVITARTAAIMAGALAAFMLLLTIVLQTRSRD